MSENKVNQLNIGETVMEQLGIEEEEDVAEVVMTDEILLLKKDIDEKDIYIRNLEYLLDNLEKRMDKLEKVVYDFKYKR